MTILIVEDEELTARKMQRLVAEVEPAAQVVGMTASVEESVEWLESHPQPDLILMDIELADGQSFEIFNRVAIRCPVIFATAYDEFAIRAFRVNSIDYLLKPVKEEDLRRALAKLRALQEALSARPDAWQTALSGLLEQLHVQGVKPQPVFSPERSESTEPPLRDRFLVKQGQRLFSVPVAEVAYFFSRNKMSFLTTRDGHEWLLDYTMDELERMLAPRQFFRLNRQVIAEIRAVEKVNLYFNGKLKINLRPDFDEEVIVSREKAADFKRWLGE